MFYRRRPDLLNQLNGGTAQRLPRGGVGLPRGTAHGVLPHGAGGGVLPGGGKFFSSIDPQLRPIIRKLIYEAEHDSKVVKSEDQEEAEEADDQPPPDQTVPGEAGGGRGDGGGTAAQKPVSEMTAAEKQATIASAAARSPRRSQQRRKTDPATIAEPKAPTASAASAQRREREKGRAAVGLTGTAKKLAFGEVSSPLPPGQMSSAPNAPSPAPASGGGERDVVSRITQGRSKSPKAASEGSAGGGTPKRGGSVAARAREWASKNVDSPNYKSRQRKPVIVVSGGETLAFKTIADAARHFTGGSVHKLKGQGALNTIGESRERDGRTIIAATPAMLEALGLEAKSAVKAAMSRVKSKRKGKKKVPYSPSSPAEGGGE